MSPKILVAGIGNIFLGDDAFGSVVARRLAIRDLPEDVQVIDFGIRGLDLAYRLLDPSDLTIFVDTVQRGGEPGTVYTIEPDVESDSIDQVGDQFGGLMIEPHAMNPARVIQMARGMGAEFKRILLVGCEPETLGGDEGYMGLSAPVEAAVDTALHVIERLIDGDVSEYGGKSMARSASVGVDAGACE
ncbi:MAG TPA: hydrogenase maturation protease [Blastocatellia bacterium]|nr:hydrogenase maturation protease [Blastocatellia bacterium]